MNPFQALAGEVCAPVWSGPTRVHRMEDDDQPTIAAPKPTEDLRALRALQLRAARAVLAVCPAWSLITPGSPKEALCRKVPAALWWTFPGELS